MNDFDPTDPTRPRREFPQAANSDDDTLPGTSSFGAAQTPEEGGEALTVAASLNADALRNLLTNRNFVPLWIGQMVSYLGDQFMLIAALSIVAKLAGSNSGIATAGLGISNALPSILLGLIGGVLVDRLNRKTVMIVSDFIRGSAILSLLLVNNDPSRLWMFFAVLAINGAASTLFYPARASALPAIVSRKTLAGANALLEAGFVLALVFGSLFAGTLTEAYGPNLALSFNGAAYFFSAFMIYLIKIPRHVHHTSESSAGQVWHDLKDGLRYIWRTRSMRYIIGLSVMVSGSIGGVLVLALNYLNKVLNVGPSRYGLVVAILGVGIIVGGVLIQQLSRFLPTNRLVGMAILLNGLAMLGFVLQPVFEIVCVFTALMGFSIVVARAVLGTLTQAIPPEEYRGRVQGAFNLISSAPLAIAVGLAGLLLQVFLFQYSFRPGQFIPLPTTLRLYNESSSQWVVFAGFGIALLLTAWLAVNMLRGIDEAIYSEST